MPSADNKVTLVQAPWEKKLTDKEESVWKYLVENRRAETKEVAEACGVEEAYVDELVSRIGSPNWRDKVSNPKTKNRADILDTAKEYVTKDRAADHGDMEDNFLTIAAYWNTHLGIYSIGPQDVAVMMTLLKLARIRQNEKHLDNWIDACGYMACGGEIITGDYYHDTETNPSTTSSGD